MCLFYMSGSRKGERTRVFVRTQDQVAKNVMFTESDVPRGIAPSSHGRDDRTRGQGQQGVLTCTLLARGVGGFPR